MTMIDKARGWRGLAKLVVIVEGPSGPEQHAVKLGEVRRRWKRVEQQLDGANVIGARGYDDAGELIGSWDAEESGQDDDDEPSVETDEQAQHRQHTQWVIREMRTVFGVQQQLVLELGQAIVEMFRRSLAPAAPAAAPDDEASKTLGLLLQTVMAQQNQRGNDAEEERSARSQGGDPGRPGAPTEPDETRP